MTRKTKSAQLSDGNSVVKTVRFPKDEFKILEGIAEKKGMGVSALIRDCTIAHIHNTAEHEGLIDSLGPEDPEKVQKNFFDVLNNANEAVLKTVTNNAQETRKKLKLIDALIRELMYLIMYFNREVPAEEKEGRQMSAKKRLKDFLEVFDKGFS